MRKSLLFSLIIGVILILGLAACSGQKATETPQTQPPAATEEQHKEADAGHDEGAEDADHGGDDHGVSAGEEALKNPVPATEASIASGAEVYAGNCVVCHGETGLGDGVAGKALDPPPANLHEDHVQILTDGGLFTIIHKGVEGTGMPGFGETLKEDDIWNLVNYIRTFKEE